LVLLLKQIRKLHIEKFCVFLKTKLLMRITMKKVLFLVVFIAACLAVFSQEAGTLTDPRDGKIYKTVKIGNQWMMAENLAYRPEKGVYWADSVYLDKDPYSVSVKTYLILDRASMEKLGYFYDFETANTIAMPGWHVPTKDEWKVLIKYLGGNAKKVYSAMIAGGSSGFNAGLNGLGSTINGSRKSLVMMDEVGYFWSSSKAGLQGIALCFVPPATRFNAGAVRIGLAPKIQGYNVRLFKDN
jgi:uncharacterized protein (TIGR02145 family)